MLAIKEPNKLQGSIISKYLKDILIRLNFKLGIAFLIFDKFNNDITDIEIKKDVVIALMPNKGVKTTKETRSDKEPKM